MIEFLYSLASHICGQVNLWSVGGNSLPLCQRCTGLYAGAAFAAVLLGTLHPAFSRSMFAVHAAMIVAMIPLGYHLTSQSADVRTLSGFAYGVALVYFLSIGIGKKNSDLPATGLVALAYFGMLALCGALLLAALHHGTERSVRAIVLLNVSGFVALLVMSVQAVMSFFSKPAVTAT